MLGKPGTFMTVVCPICKSSHKRFHIPGAQQASIAQLNGAFKVADVVFAEAKAEHRAEPEENELPLIVLDDFY